MDGQVTFRIPRDLMRALARQARERRVPKSQVVREALAQYVAGAREEAEAAELWRRLQPFVGSMPLDHAAIEADEIARQIYRDNWRE